MWKMALLCSAAIACNGAAGGPVLFTASGESLALGGYDFPGDPSFVDGWEIRFTKFLAVFDHVTLSQNPDAIPTDQSQTGKRVAEIDGPWAVDLHKGGPLTGKGGSDEQAVAIEMLVDQNQNGGAGFDPTVRYAFGFDSVAATASAKLIGIDTADPDYAQMVAHDWNVFYLGTATFKGTSCTNSGGAEGDAAIASLPTVVTFKLGFKTPTSYVNCQNHDTGSAPGLNGEEHLRGIQTRENATTLAQVTFHTDHPFWESFEHDTPAHFDQPAALAQKQPDGSFLVTNDDALGVDYKAFKAPNGKPLPWHVCQVGYVPPDMSAQMSFRSGNIPESAAGDPKLVMRDYKDYLAYDQSTQGHLNSDGLCYVARHYDSPQ